MKKAILIVNIPDSVEFNELSDAEINITRFDKMKNIHRKSKVISMDDFVEYAFPKVYERVVHAMLFGVSDGN